MQSNISSGESSSVNSGSSGLYTVRNAFREIRKRDNDNNRGLTFDQLGANTNVNDRTLFDTADQNNDGRLRFRE